MKRILCSSFLLVLLAACSSVPLEEASTSPAGATGSAPNIALQPLVVPAASAFRTTRARPLSGKFQKASWADLPGWDNDSLAHVGKDVINNCQGLSRPGPGYLKARRDSGREEVDTEG